MLRLHHAAMIVSPHRLFHLTQRRRHLTFEREAELSFINDA